MIARTLRIASALYTVDALLRTGKTFDLMVLPAQSDHYRGYAFDDRGEAIRRHLQEHLEP